MIRTAERRLGAAKPSDFPALSFDTATFDNFLEYCF